MNIGTEMKAVRVERIGGPRQAPIQTPVETPVAVPAMATVEKRVLVTA